MTALSNFAVRHSRLAVEIHAIAYWRTNEYPDITPNWYLNRGAGESVISGLETESASTAAGCHRERGTNCKAMTSFALPILSMFLLQIRLSQANRQVESVYGVIETDSVGTGSEKDNFFHVD